MSVPFEYFGHGSHMSAVLKRDMHHARTARSDLLKTVTVRESSMDGEGKVTVTERKVQRLVGITPRARHALSLQTEWFR